MGCCNLQDFMPNMRFCSPHSILVYINYFEMLFKFGDKVPLNSCLETLGSIFALFDISPVPRLLWSLNTRYSMLMIYIICFLYLN
jgi:hypothetical protein